MFERLSRFRLVVPFIMTLIGLSILIGLGTWQLQRRTWKDGIIARIKAQQGQPPVSGTASWPDLPCRTISENTLDDPCEYQPVSLRGVFDHAQERHIFTASPKAPGVPTTSPGGYWVFVPMRIDGGARTVYVNRGFVPETLKDQSRRVTGQPTQPVEITGLYRSSQKRAMLDGANDPAKNIWYVRNPAELWALGAAAPAYLDMAGPVPAGGWPLPLAGKVELSNRHLEYALTWYGLAATLVGVFGVFAWGRVSASGRT